MHGNKHTDTPAEYTSAPRPLPLKPCPTSTHMDPPNPAMPGKVPAGESKKDGSTEVLLCYYVYEDTIAYHNEVL